MGTSMSAVRELPYAWLRQSMSKAGEQEHAHAHRMHASRACMHAERVMQSTLCLCRMS